MKRLAPGLLLLGVFLLVAPSWAHYPLLLTERAVVEQGQTVRIECTNGHPYANDRYASPRPERVCVYEPQRSTPRDLIAHVTTAGTTELPKWILEHKPRKSGDHIYSWHCGMFFEKPHRYVEDYAKLTIHVRDDGGAQIGWARTIGDPLEIVPLTRPYLVPVGSVFRGKVLLYEQPMNDGVVEAETYADASLPKDTYLPDYRLGARTDDQGVFALTLPKPGWWLLAIATDGGPGEQGTQKGVAQRATFWVHVGGTVFDKQE